MASRCLPQVMPNRTCNRMYAECDQFAENLKATLCNKSIDVNGIDKWGYTLLHRASMNGQAVVIDILLRIGAHIDAGDSLLGSTALGFAVRYGHAEVVGLLLSKGSDISQTDTRGYSLIYRAIRSGRTKMVHMLITEGASIDADNENGKVALEFALERGRKNSVSVLTAWQEVELGIPFQCFLCGYGLIPVSTLMSKDTVFEADYSKAVSTSNRSGEIIIDETMPVVAFPLLDQPVPVRKEVVLLCHYPIAMEIAKYVGCVSGIGVDFSDDPVDISEL